MIVKYIVNSARYNSVRIFNYLCDRFPKQAENAIRYRDKHHNNSLLHNCFELDIVRKLLYLGADINAVDNDGDTPLHIVVDFGEEYIEVVKLLLDYGADTTIKNNKGKRPIDKAINNLPSEDQIIDLLNKHEEEKVDVKEPEFD
jgi:ankyrin repeat protein